MSRSVRVVLHFHTFDTQKQTDCPSLSSQESGSRADAASLLQGDSQGFTRQLINPDRGGYYLYWGDVPIRKFNMDLWHICKLSTWMVEMTGNTMDRWPVCGCDGRKLEDLEKPTLTPGGPQSSLDPNQGPSYCDIHPFTALTNLIMSKLQMSLLCSLYLNLQT